MKELCLGCGEEKELEFHPWVNNPGPASGISTLGVYVCKECAEIAEQYED